VTPPTIAVMTVILALLIVAILVVLARVNKLRRRLSEQAEALRKASETTTGHQRSVPIDAAR